MTTRSANIVRASGGAARSRIKRREIEKLEFA
jgi:hypothetical protein